MDAMKQRPAIFCRAVLWLADPDRQLPRRWPFQSWRLEPALGQAAG